MYNVKGPSTIVAKSTRRGISQNLDNFRDHSRNKSVDANDNVINVPKPIFQNVPKRLIPNHLKQQKVITPQHEELIRYINDSWSSVCSEVEKSSLLSNGSSSPRSDHSTLFYEDEPCPHLQNFKPFDLESWWGKRLYTFITNSVNSNN